MHRPGRPMALTERHVAFLQPPAIMDEMPPPPAGMIQAARWKTLLTGQPHEPRALGKKKHGGHGDGGVE